MNKLRITKKNLKKFGLFFLIVINLISSTQAVDGKFWGVETNDTYYFTKSISMTGFKEIDYETEISITINSVDIGGIIYYFYQENIKKLDIPIIFLDRPTVIPLGYYLSASFLNISMNHSSSQNIYNANDKIALIYSFPEFDAFLANETIYENYPSQLESQLYMQYVTIPNTNEEGLFNMQRSNFHFDFTQKPHGFQIEVTIADEDIKIIYEKEYNKNGILDHFYYAFYSGDSSTIEEIKSRLNPVLRIVIPVSFSIIGIAGISGIYGVKIMKKRKLKIGEDKRQMTISQSEARSLIKVMKYSDALEKLHIAQDIAQTYQENTFLIKIEQFIELCHLNSPYSSELRNIMIDSEKFRPIEIADKLKILLLKIQGLKLEDQLDPNLLQSIHEEKAKIIEKSNQIGHSYKMMKTRFNS